jgi:pyrroline-5-carboxylate reductase
MAAAMARGWAGAEGGPDLMLFCDLEVERAQALAEEVDGETRAGLAELGSDSDVVVLAVKPAALDDAAADLAATARSLISVLAATPTTRLAEAFAEVPVLRVMPNQPVEVRRGVVCYVPAPGMDDAVSLLRLLGSVVPLEEKLMDAAMAVMSCSPAYVAFVAEALARAGEREGLDPSLANELVAGAFAGTAELLQKRQPGEIRRAVAPPGGATEAGLEALEQGGVGEAFAAAVDASLARFR